MGQPRRCCGDVSEEDVVWMEGRVVGRWCRHSIYTCARDTFVPSQVGAVHRFLKCGLIRPKDTFPLCVSPYPMSSGPESLIFLDAVDALHGFTQIGGPPPVLAFEGLNLFTLNQDAFNVSPSDLFTTQVVLINTQVSRHPTVSLASSPLWWIWASALRRQIRITQGKIN